MNIGRLLYWAGLAGAAAIITVSVASAISAAFDNHIDKAIAFSFGGAFGAAIIWLLGVALRRVANAVATPPEPDTVQAQASFFGEGAFGRILIFAAMFIGALALSTYAGIDGGVMGRILAFTLARML